MKNKNLRFIEMLIILIGLLAMIPLMQACTKKETSFETPKLTKVIYDVQIDTPQGHRYSLSVDYQTKSGIKYHKLRFFTEPKDTVITITDVDITYTAIEVIKTNAQTINGKATVYFNDKLKSVVLPETNKITFRYGNYIR